MLETTRNAYKIFVRESEGENLEVKQDTFINFSYSHTFIVQVCFRYTKEI